MPAVNVCYVQVTRTARMMIEQMGFSDQLGQVAWAGGGGPSFLGAEAGQASDFSQETRDKIDSEVRAVQSVAERTSCCTVRTVRLLIRRGS